MQYTDKIMIPYYKELIYSNVELRVAICLQIISHTEVVYSNPGT
jgi:hypothetical protein